VTSYEWRGSFPLGECHVQRKQGRRAAPPNPSLHGKLGF